MKLEDINQKVFHSEISDIGMRRMENAGVLPNLCEIDGSDSVVIASIVEKWKSTFLGAFVYRYPKYYGMIKRMAEVFGKSPEWADFTKQNIRRLVDEFSDGCAPSTLKTYLAMIKAVLNDAKDEHDIPCKKFDEELTVKNTPSVGVYLNLSDISKLESYKPANERENIVLAQFLCGCYTGARHSDILSMTEDNISGKYLTYVSQKTKIAATVEAKSNLKEMLAISSKKKYADSLFNQTIRDICKKAGVNEPVRVFRAGESISGKKYEFVASHTARRSFATNLAELGVPILQISKRMGHTDIKMTQHYIVSPIGALDERGMKYFE